MSTNAERQRRFQKKRREAVAQLPDLLARIAELEAENEALRAENVTVKLELANCSSFLAELEAAVVLVTNASPQKPEALVTPSEDIEYNW
jgi:transposase-like protein